MFDPFVEMLRADVLIMDFIFEMADVFDPMEVVMPFYFCNEVLFRVSKLRN